MHYEPVAVKVWGDWACWTQPEFSAERVSYSCMTASAARGILESICWKPEFRWRVRCIEVLHPMPPAFPATPDVRPSDRRTNRSYGNNSHYRHFSIMRNEVDRRATETPILITESRTQRHSLVLRDVCYVIRADVEVLSGVNADPAKYRDQFQRRVRQGRCYSRPYLGCREFSCDFGPLDGSEEAQRFHHQEPIPLGLMLFDILHGANGSSVPIFFPAQLEDGRLNIDPALYERFRT